MIESKMKNLRSFYPFCYALSITSRTNNQETLIMYKSVTGSNKKVTQKTKIDTLRKVF